MDSCTPIIDVLNDLHSWLGSLQVRPDPIKIEKANGELFLQYRHPLNGKVDVALPQPSAGLVRIDGVGFKIANDAGREMAQVMCVDQGGIFDPLDWCVPGDHYATSHFALLSAQLFILNSEEKYLDYLKSALLFYLSNGNRYPFSNWPPHWEFDNFAWAEAYKLIRGFLPGELVGPLEDRLASAPMHRFPYATNWKLLSIDYCFNSPRGGLARRVMAGLRVLVYQHMIRKAILNDGCIEDIPGSSRPIQYHAFSGALLCRQYDKSHSESLGRRILGAANYLLSFVDPEGNFNYKGRGQNQIFGFAPAIYLLLQAHEIEKKRNASAAYLSGARAIYAYLSRHQTSKGFFPLVLNNLEWESKAGWFDYHHLTVYNAFLGAWLGAATLRFPDTIDTLHVDEPASAFRAQGAVFYPESNVLIYHKSDIFLCISGGEYRYETDCGLAPHHIYIEDWGPIVSCPGGPDEWEFGRRHRTEIMNHNFFAPLLIEDDHVIGPAHSTVKMMEWYEEAELLELEVEYPRYAKVARQIRFLASGIEFHDAIRIITRSPCISIIGFNLPIIRRSYHRFQLHDRSIELTNHQGDNLTISVRIQGPISSLSLSSPFVGKTSAGDVVVFRSQPIRTLLGQSFHIHQLWQIS